MYLKYIEKKSWSFRIIHESKNDVGGYRNVTFEVMGKNVYGTLKNEAGVHRLVRISPFSAKNLRHTSFAMVEVTPQLREGGEEIEIPDTDLKIEFSRSSGPGGQNVNKRETAVRIVHIPTGISVHVSTKRSQVQNRETALSILKGKLFRKKEEDEKKEKSGFHISKTTEATWGSQIRSYVFHPYKMVKDHRTEVEIHDVESVLLGGLDKFIEAERDL